MPRLSRLTPALALDAAIVVFVAAVTEWQVFDEREHLSTHVAGPRWLTVPLALLIAVPLFWRRRRALAVCVLVLGGLAAQAIASGHSFEGLQVILVWVLVPYGVAAYTDRRHAYIGLAVVLAGFTIYALENDDIMSGRAGDLWSGAFFGVLALGAWLAGLVIRGRREGAALAAHAEALEREAQLATAEERARMARELHDIVSHNLSVVVVQAAGARARAEHHDPDPGTLEKIERAGRDALVEMRRLLGVLREDESSDAGLSPRPGLAQLPALAQRLRTAGLSVLLDVDRDFADLPAAVDLSAYRIVQEALTNTLRHAGAEAHVRVRVRREAGALAIDVADDGGGRTAEPGRNGAGGHGLVGMRERAALFGGVVHAAPRAGGGFLVEARLPLGAAGAP